VTAGGDRCGRGLGDGRSGNGDSQTNPDFAQPTVSWTHAARWSACGWNLGGK